MIRPAFVLVFALPVSALASLAHGQSSPMPPKTVQVVMEGRAAGTNENAMEQAKQDALRRAVEQTCGTFINGQTQTKNYAAIYDRALASAAGYVDEFQILERRVENGVSYCKVKAVVSTVSFESEWTRLAHTLVAEDDPRCIVIVVEDNDANDLKGPETNGVVQSVLEKFLLDKGVQLMDRGAADEARSRDVSLAAMNDDVNKLAAMAAAFKADVAVKGNAEARRAGVTQMGGRDLYKWTATINVRAFHADSAQMLMSNTYRGSHTTVNENAGGDEALRKCAEQSAPAILRDIGEAWRKRQNVRRVAQLVLENCSRKDFKTFEAALREVDGVQGVRLREMVNNTCQVEVDWSYDLERLIGRIEDLKVDKTSYEITEQTHDRVTLKLVK